MSEFTIYDFISQLRDPEPDVRRYAAWYLGRFRDDLIKVALIEALQDPEPSVRVRVVEALGAFRGDSVIAALTHCGQFDPEAQVSAQAVRSLALQQEVSVLPVLRGRLDADSPEVRAAAVEALGRLQDSEAVPMLIQVLLADPDDTTRYHASRALIAIGGSETALALAAAIEHTPSPEVRTYIAEILGQLRIPETAFALQKLAADEEALVAETARWALWRMGQS